MLLRPFLIALIYRAGCGFRNIRGDYVGGKWAPTVPTRSGS